MSKRDYDVERFLMKVFILIAVGWLLGCALLYTTKAEASHFEVIANPPPGFEYPGGYAPYSQFMAEVEEGLGLPDGILREVANRESGFKSSVINCKVDGLAGEKGMMQIIPSYHPGARPCSPPHAISYAAHYLADLRIRYKSWTLALAAYNWGPGNVNRMIRSRGKLPKTVSDYVRTIFLGMGVRVNT